MNVLTVNDLHLDYGSGASANPILNGVSMHLQRGEVTTPVELAPLPDRVRQLGDRPHGPGDVVREHGDPERGRAGRGCWWSERSRKTPLSMIWGFPYALQHDLGKAVAQEAGLAGARSPAVQAGTLTIRTRFRAVRP